MTFKSGFVAVIGRPNVGKSTLTNFLTGRKISIMSPKPQTTRNTIRAIVTSEQSQIVFLDTPGIHTPKNKLGKFMVNQAFHSLKDVDCVVYIVEPIRKEILEADLRIMDNLKDSAKKVILLINKIDRVTKESLLKSIELYSKALPFGEIIPVSLLKKENTEQLSQIIENYLPEGPMYFDKDDITDQLEKVIVSEYIREKVLLFLREEVPHGVGVEVVTFTKRSEKQIIDIEANIYCERKTHKGIIIGKKGSMLKKIGSSARKDIENLLGTKVFLTLWVKVKEDWRNSNFMLKNLGYTDNES
ncbi:MAG: GTPase Era [Clostridiales bacterium]|nr:GTPase Era [Clostridiales bacterium]